MQRKNKIQNLIQDGKTPVCDGAWGTYLQAMGLPPGECPEWWNITHPAEVLSIASAYVEAGADIIETNSFGGCPVKLEHYGLQDKTEEINEAAARISRQAAGNKVIVMGSTGPSGKILMTGDITEEELYKSFAVQAKGLEKGGADAIVVETMSDIDEALIAIKAVRDHTSCEIVCTFTFEKTVGGEYRTMMGYDPADVVERLKNAGAAILGANCGNGIRGMVDIVQEFRKVTRMPLLVQANAGLPVLENGHTHFPESPEEMASIAPLLLKAGVSAIGGCCGTGPEHIKKLVETLRK